MKTILLIVMLTALGCADGARGPAGSSGPSGPSGPVGPAGTDGSNGADGAAGANGSDGATGATGADGTPGTLISPIQLCDSSFVPTYPNIFPEVAFCIDNVLYASYSTHGGFLAPLPPGTYSSNGLHASCTFTVVSGCTISN